MGHLWPLGSERGTLWLWGGRDVSGLFVPSQGEAEVISICMLCSSLVD